MPERIKPDEATYQSIKHYGPEELKQFLKDNSKAVSDDLFKIEDLVEGVRRRRQLIAIAEKQLDSLTTRVSNPPEVKVNFGAGVLVTPKGLDVSVVDDNLDEVSKAVASTRTAHVDMGNGIRVPTSMIVGFDKIVRGELDEAAPVPATPPQERVVNPGGRIPESVLSRDQWLKLMESREGARDVALYHDRSETGMFRTRTRALTGDFPESKHKKDIFQMLYDGYTVDEVATEYNRSTDWIQNVANYLAAVIRRQKSGLPVPDLGIEL